MAHEERRGLGLLGLFDVDDLDVQLRARVARHELARRRPDLTLRLFAPFGSTRPIAVAADLPVEPLAPATTARLEALQAELDAVVVIGTTDNDTTAAYGGHPAVDPRDVAACRALLAAPPASLPTGHDPVAPHPALLARRVWPYGVCEQRREFLRAMHWWPQRAVPVVIAGGDADVPHVEALAARLRLGDREITVVGAGPGPDSFAAALTDRLPRRAHLVPASASSVDDRVAAVAGASAVVSSSPAVLALADAYGRPRRSMEAFAGAPASRTARRGAETVARDEAKLDAAYDALAALVAGDRTPELATGEVAALRGALDAQARRVAHERVVLADYARALRNNAAQEAAELRDALAERPLQRLRGALRRRH